MQPNFLILAIAALVPLIMGFIWYHPKTFGTAWMNTLGITADSKKGANMAKIFILTYILSFLATTVLQFLVIHQTGYYSLLANEPGLHDAASPVSQEISTFMGKYGHNFRTFKHGVLHGVLAGIFLVMPIIGINGLFERKSFKYVAINAGFWTVCLAIMGGIICQWA